ncbi:MAG: plastocyanin/azurin family copper-binding protein, partial [Nitrososphaeraceae archaeon]
MIKKIAFLPLLLIIGSLYAYGQIPEEYYAESQLYPNKKSNDELALSIDDTVYARGDTVNVFGLVKHFNSGVPVLIQVYDPNNKQILDLTTVAGNLGNFRVPFKILQDAMVGKYTVSAKYGTAGKLVSVEFTITGGNEIIIDIPRGSSTGDTKFNFTPKNITVNYGAKITWINNDISLHTVVSGKVGLDKRMFADGIFDSGTFAPAYNFTRQFFKEGAYQYFCILHPWLVGQIIVKPYTGPPNQRPVPQQEPAAPSEENLGNYLTITIQRLELESNQKTLFDDNIASSFKTWKYVNSSSTITISDTTDAKVGINSLRILVETHNGDAAVFHDYSKEKLQDWSNYNYLNFWFKGQNTKQTIPVMMMNESRYLRVVYNIIDDTTDWEKVQIPLYPNNNIDLSKVRGLEFHFNKGTKGEFFIDDILLANNADEQKILTDKDTYIFGETIFVSGNIPNRESPSSSVAIKVIDPTQNIVTVNQVPLASDNTFRFTLHVSGGQFDKEGTYKISAQYGVARSQNSTSFELIVPQLVETYKGFDLYQVGDTNYSVLQREGGFDINRMRAEQYSVILNGNSLDGIKKTIDERTAIVEPTPSEPLPSLPVSDDVLLAMWNDRKDLQSAYPEVKQGNLDNLKLWAIKTGWKEDSRLSVLVPNGEIPDYLKPNKTISETKLNDDSPNVLLWVGAIIAIVIVGIIGYKF